MKKLYTTILIALLSVNVFGQIANWQWAKTLGEPCAYPIAGITTDANGNLYATGVFYTPYVVFGNDTLFGNVGGEFYIVKYDANSNVLWAKNAGGTCSGQGLSISTDNSGIYVTGFFCNCNTSFGSFTLTNAGGCDMFIVKYSYLGSILWAQSIGGNSDEMGSAVATDGYGNVFVTGNFNSPTINIGSTTLTHLGPDTTSDIFVVKYNSTGTVLWAKSGGGNSHDRVNSIATDHNGNTYITGYFDSPSLNFGTTTITIAATDTTNDAFIVRYDANGNVAWAQGAGGNYGDVGNAIATDFSGNIYLTGWFCSNTINFGSYTLTNSDAVFNTADIFLVKYDSTGTVIWAKSNVGNSSSDESNSIATDASGNIYLAGYFYSDSIIMGTTTLVNRDPTRSSSDMFVEKYDASGNVLYGINIGGSSADYIWLNALATDASNNVYLNGYFASTTVDFGTTTLSYIPNIYAAEGYIAKLGSTTGIEEMQNTNTLTIAPNPTSSSFTITSSSKIETITITDVLGQSIEHLTINNNQSTINISQLPSGIYFLSIQDQNKNIINRKIIKQ